MSSTLKKVGLVVVLVFAASVLATSAQAQPKDAERKAKALYEKGKVAYRSGDYETARDLWESAYRTSPNPGLFYNLGQVYERIGDLEKAIEYFERYLKTPNADRADSTRKKLDRLIKRVEQEKADAEARRLELESRGTGDGGTGTAGGTGTGDGGTGSGDGGAGTSSGAGGTSGGGGGSITIEPAPSPPNTRMYVSFGGAGALLLTGVGFAFAAKSAGDDAAKLCQKLDGRRYCPASADGALGREKTFTILGDVSMAAGVVALGVGTMFLFIREKPEQPASKAVTVGPSFMPGGAGVSFAGRF